MFSNIGSQKNINYVYIIVLRCKESKTIKEIAAIIFRVVLPDYVFVYETPLEKYW